MQGGPLPIIIVSFHSPFFEEGLLGPWVRGERKQEMPTPLMFQ